MKTPTPLICHLLCALFFFLPLNAALAQSIDIKTISAEPFSKVIKRTGKLEFKRTLSLSFKTTGYLAKINVDESDSFVKGKILAELDTFELVTEKNSSYARLLQAKKDVTRIKTLLDKNLSSRQALDNAKTLVETTRASHKLAQYNLEKSQLIAPFDGVVLNRLSELAELQNPNKAALQVVAKNNNLVVRVALTSKEVALLNLNQSVQVSFSQGVLSPEVTTGIVSKIPVFNDLASQLYTIEVFLAEVNVKEVTVGQLVKVTFNLEHNSYVYRIPIAALNSIDEQGKLLITLQLTTKDNEKYYQQQVFVIEQLDNDYIYLSTEQNALPLTVVIQGWQSLKKASYLVGENQLKTELVK